MFIVLGSGYLCHDRNVVPPILNKIINKSVQGDLDAILFAQYGT